MTESFHLARQDEIEGLDLMVVSLSRIEVSKGRITAGLLTLTRPTAGSHRSSHRGPGGSVRAAVAPGVTIVLNDDEKNEVSVLKLIGL
jgi:hypothetical protein